MNLIKKKFGEIRRVFSYGEKRSERQWGRKTDWEKKKDEKRERERKRKNERVGSREGKEWVRKRVRELVDCEGEWESERERKEQGGRE